MVRVIDQEIPPELYWPYRGAAHPAARHKDLTFGAKRFNTFKFGESQPPWFVKKRYPWRVPGRQGGGEF